MRIAQVAPLAERVPPKLYGGTERVVSHLTEELVGQGHDVTLFASGDSLTRARLVPCCDTALRLSPRCVDPLPHHLTMLQEVFRRADEFEVIHFHLDYLHFPLVRRQAAAHVTTQHGRLDIPDLAPLFMEYADLPMVSISDAQRRPMPWANWQATIYHGLPPELYSFHERPAGGGGYLAYIGRCSPEKGIARAIEIARRADMEIRIAVKVDKHDREYFEQVLTPLMRQPHVTCVGEIGEDRKDAFIGGAAAVLFPIGWPEPFGLVLIEAMACGTPVIAFRYGSVEEVVEDGVSGFVCDGVGQAVEAVRRLGELSRRGCRAAFERRFTAARMTRDYVELYRRLTEAKPHGRDHPGRGPTLHPGHLAPAG